MRQLLSPGLDAMIDQQAAEVQRLAEQAGPVALDRLRDETATLQALIAEARRLERLTNS